MEYNIYLDVFFLRNFIMNGVILAAAGRILRKNGRWIRIALAAAAGAFINCFPLVLRGSFVGLPFLVAVMMNLLAFGKGTGKEHFLSSFLLFFMAFCLEGALEWISMITNANGNKTWQSSLFTIFFVLAISCLIGKERRKQEQEMAVILTFKDRQKELQGFYDSGNQLVEPLTGKMVHIACYDDVKELLPTSYQEVAETYFKTGFFENTKVTKLQMYEFTFLSYHSIGKETGQLLGIRMDSAVFRNHAGKKTEERPVIGLADQKLFVRGQGRMIINGRLEL